MSATELEAFLRDHLPRIDTSIFRIETVDSMRVGLRLRPRPQDLRPGETVSGPTLMMLADTAVYLAVLAMLGPEIVAVTSNLNIHFLRRPGPADVIAEARLLRLGRRSAVGEVTMHSEDEPAAPVAVATVGYAIRGAEPETVSPGQESDA